MKKIFTILSILLLILPMGLAQVQSLTKEQEQKILLQEAGLTPESPLYGLSVALERLTLIFKDDKGRAIARIKLANERIAEAKLMADRNNEKASKRALLELDNEEMALDEEKDKLNDDEKSEIQPEFYKHTEVLKGIIDKIRSDDNPNNDNALKGLEIALENADAKYNEFRLSIPAEKRKDENTLKNQEEDKDLLNQEQKKFDLFSVYSLSGR